MDLFVVVNNFKSNYFQAELTKRSANKNASQNNQNFQQSAGEASNLQSCLMNLIVLIGFAAFAFTVKYVMKTSISETE